MGSLSVAPAVSMPYLLCSLTKQLSAFVSFRFRDIHRRHETICFAALARRS